MRSSADGASHGRAIDAQSCLHVPPAVAVASRSPGWTIAVRLFTVGVSYIVMRFVCDLWSRVKADGRTKARCFGMKKGFRTIVRNPWWRSQRDSARIAPEALETLVFAGSPKIRTPLGTPQPEIIGVSLRGDTRLYRFPSYRRPKPFRRGPCRCAERRDATRGGGTNGAPGHAAGRGSGAPSDRSSDPRMSSRDGWNGAPGHDGGRGPFGPGARSRAV